MQIVANSVHLVSGGNVIKYGDETPFTFQLNDETGNQVDLTDANVTVRMANDKIVVMNKEAIINDDNTVTFNIGEDDLTGHGNMRVEFVVTYPDSTTEIFPARDYQEIRIIPSLGILDDGYVAVVTLEEFENKFEEAEQRVNNVIDQANIAIQNANSKANYAQEQGDYAKNIGDNVNQAESIRESNESNRIQAESQRQANEQVRIDSENQREQKESTRESNEQARINEEQTRQSNEVDRINAENIRQQQEQTRQTNTSAALNQVNQSLQDVDTAITNADQAANNANTKANYAEQQGDYAKSQGDYAKNQGEFAESEASNLSQIKSDVQQATTNANTAADNANQATASANTQANYAQQQGDYAKSQGDWAKSQAELIDDILDDGLVASVNGQTGVVNLTAQDVGAETPQGAQSKADAAEQNAKNYTDQEIAKIPDPTWENLQNKPTQFPPAPHSHNISNINGLQNALDSKETPSGAQSKVDALAGAGNTKTVKQIDDELTSHKAEIATKSKLGHVMVDGETITITSSGVISSQGGLSEQEIDDKINAHASEDNVHGLRNEEITLGYNALVGGIGSIAIGHDASTTAHNSVALGKRSKAYANATAIGSDSEALGNGSVALGSNGSASGGNAIALKAEAKNDYEIVLGSNTTTLGQPNKTIVPGSFSVGGTKNFEIPHPKPEKRATHVIRHGAVESPTAGDTLYRYKVQATKENDLQTINLPDYFIHLNKDVQTFVTPQGHFGNGYGVLNRETEQLEIHCQFEGEYNVLVIGTRNDEHPSVQEWDIKGVEREIGESWTGETYVFSVDEIMEVEEIKEVGA